MVANNLTAVVPKRIFVFDLKRKDTVRLALLRCEVEAREDAVAACEWLARFVKARLNNRMILGHEVEFDEVPNFSYDRFGFEVQATVGSSGACENAVDNASRANLVGGCGSREAKESGGRESDGCESDHVD